MTLPASERELVLYTATALLGCPYHWGGRTAAGLDCSGFVALCLLRATHGRVDLRRWWAQLMFERFESVDEAAALPGDLAFYGDGPDGVSHVMMLLTPDTVIGAAGGRSGTTRRNAADDQCVQMRSGIRYRRDYLGMRRLPL